MFSTPLQRAAALLLSASLASILAACGKSGPASTDVHRTFAPQAENVAGCATPSVRVNFQPLGAPVPGGYVADGGAPYGTGGAFGWVREDSLSGAHVPLDLRANTRDRNRSGVDQRLDTLIHAQYSGASGVSVPGAWEYALPNGRYCVTVSVGDNPYDSDHTVNLEGQRVIDRFRSSSAREYTQASALVDVTDGRLTLDARGGRNTKFNYVEITGAAGGSSPHLAVENLDGAPYADRLVFNRISTLNFPGYGVHNLGAVRLRNTGEAPLTVKGLTLAGPFALADGVALPATIAPGGNLDVRVRFVATSGRLHSGSLTVESNDPDEGARAVQLAGAWQSVSEGGQEPLLPELLQVFGYKTVLLREGQKLANKGIVGAVGEEVLAPYWRRADTTKSVTVRQLAAFHTQNQANTLRWHAKGSTALNFVVTHAAGDAQSVLPRRYGSDSVAAGASFSPSAEVFGWRVETTWSDPKLNDTTYDRRYGCTANCGHHLRFWPVRDRAGHLVPNAYLMAMDSLGVNYDYNDNLYLVTNIRPE